MRKEIQTARDMFEKVEIPDQVAQKGLALVERLRLDSLRAEITLFEAARAHAVADGRLTVEEVDLQTVAPMALRLRRSNFIERYFDQRDAKEEEMRSLLNEIVPIEDSETEE